ncbi:histone H1-like repetitive region-containing protein [Pediococcus damnosus]|uniref:histone H1-like repetitive region-containing protein n=1 Tax=Pediococcus damnosus TaxID=51663 RepID=UPI000A40C3E6|nr:histone H1-like repetitive region-containing protein [Pediococcus damnosus]
MKNKILGNKLFKSGKVLIAVAGVSVIMTSAVIPISTASANTNKVTPVHTASNWRANDQKTVDNNMRSQGIDSINDLSKANHSAADKAAAKKAAAKKAAAKKAAAKKAAANKAAAKKAAAKKAAAKKAAAKKAAAKKAAAKKAAAKKAAANKAAAKKAAAKKAAAKKAAADKAAADKAAAKKAAADKAAADKAAADKAAADKAAADKAAADKAAADKAAADNAVGGVDNLNDPNLMSVIEKQYNIAQFAGLTSQYNVIMQNARDDGIDTTALTTAYNNLNQFMADILVDPDHASDVNRAIYKKYQDAYNAELSNIQNALQNNANNKFASAASAESQAAIATSQAFSAADSAFNQAQGISNRVDSEMAVQSSATDKAQSAADSAFSQAAADKAAAATVDSSSSSETTNPTVDTPFADKAVHTIYTGTNTYLYTTKELTTIATTPLQGDTSVIAYPDGITTALTGKNAGDLAIPVTYKGQNLYFKGTFEGLTSNGLYPDGYYYALTDTAFYGVVKPTDPSVKLDAPFLNGSTWFYSFDGGSTIYSYQNNVWTGHTFLNAQ